MSVSKVRKQLNEIVFFEAEANYTNIRLQDGKVLTSSYTLRMFQDAVSQKEFIRLNRTYLVKRDFISQIVLRKGSYYAKLKSGLDCRIPRRKETEILYNLSHSGKV